MTMKSIAALLLLSAASLTAADLPVTQVVLYKHGIGFFERSGHLAPGESARLEFNESDMNDVLKSLVISERGGGKINGLRYDSQDPLSHALENFPFQIGEAQPLTALLDQFKGARVELKMGDRTVTGTIVASRQTAATASQPERQQITLLADDGEIHSVDLGAVAGIRFSDTHLQQQFKDYLSMVATARSKDKRAVYIDSTDSKDHEVSASYTIPQPVWKSSYRLILAPTGQPMLEGWAMVDNTTGEDWTKVALSLVSGRPISFISNLYAPKYVARETIDLPDDAAAKPVLHESAYAAAPAPPAPAPMQKAAPHGMARGGGGPGGAGLRDNEDLGAALSVNGSTIAADSTTAAALGELFEYRIGQPVTIRKNESAMLPFLQQKIDARKLLIYSLNQGSEHPTNAAELTNTTGKTLDGGPITVYDGGAYGGEALMETLKSADKRLISYAVDLGARVTTAFGSKAAITREIHANRGMITTKLAAEETRTYTARNLDPKAKTLILEHPLRYGYTLLNQKPTEKTSAAYRFEIPLAASATQTFAVAEERIYDQTYQVSTMTPDVILTYVRNRDLSEVARKQLQQIADQKRLIGDNDQAITDASAQVTSLTADETRIRQNITSLNSVSGQQQQVQNYARQLDDHEQQLATLRDKQSDLQKKKTSLAADLARMLDSLSF